MIFEPSRVWRSRNIPWLVLGATVVCVPLASAAGTLLIAEGSSVFSARSSIEKTVLDQRVESSRQIRQALASPVPPPAPLPPITAKAEHALRGTEVAEAPNRSRRHLSSAARDAFASTDWSMSYREAPQYRAPAVRFDRHTSNY